MSTRAPAVAGMFYPSDPKELEVVIQQLLEQSDAAPAHVHALIVPHAGYHYSGAVAASAYTMLKEQTYTRVVLLGPAHRVAVKGIALPNVSAFATPLGEVALDSETIARASHLPFVKLRDDAHAHEHALEVQLPFLQTLLYRVPLVPAIVGVCRTEEVVQFLQETVSDNTLVVISTDLSHYLPYEHAQKIDADTIYRIEHLQNNLLGEQACGAYPLNGFLSWVATKHWQVKCVDARNSGDADSENPAARERVVGYASFIVS